MEAALDAGAPLDRDDPEDRAAADAHCEAVAPVWRRLKPKSRLALILPYVRSLGLLPRGLVRRLDAALRGTPADKQTAAGLIGAIARDVPDALADLRPGAVVQAAAVNALAELGYPPAQAVERALEIIVGPASTSGLNAFDDEAAVAGALERVRVAASAGNVVPAVGRADIIKWVLDLLRRLRRNRSDPPPSQPSPPQTRSPERRPDAGEPRPPAHPPQPRPRQRLPELPPLPPSEQVRRSEPPATTGQGHDEAPGLPAQAERILRRFPPDRRDLIRREFIDAGRIGEVKDYTVNIDIGGGLDVANEDFDRFVRTFGGDPARAQLDTSAYPPVGVRWYRFPDGMTINVRPSSSSHRPTVEILFGRRSIARRY